MKIWSPPAPSPAIQLHEHDVHLLDAVAQSIAEGLGEVLWRDDVWTDPAARRDVVRNFVAEALRKNTGVRIVGETTLRVLREAEHAARATKEDLEDFLENAVVAIHRVDRDGIIRWANRAELEILGYAPDEYIGHHIREFHIDAPVIDDILQRCSRGETLRDVRARMRAKDGRILTVEISSNVRLRDGELVSTRCFMRDVTGLEHAEAERDAVFRTSQLLNAELELDRVVQRLTDEATRLCGAEFGAFFYNEMDASGESYLLYTLSGAPREQFAKFRMPRVTKLFEPTFRGEGVVRVDDVTRDPRYTGTPEGHLPVRSYLAVPVIGNGEVLGGLFFGHSQPARFTAREERLISAIATQAASAIANARLYAAERRARAAAELAQRRTTLLHDITSALSCALTAEEAARVVIRETRHLLGAASGAVLLLDETRQRAERFIVEGEYDADLAARMVTMPLATKFPLFESARTGHVTWVTGAEAIAARYPLLAKWRDEFNAGACGAVPIVFEGRVLGSMGFHSTGERALSTDDQSMLLAIGRQCGQAIERARLHELTQRARAEAEQASRAKDEFLAMLGHELRNPLSPILTAVQLMRLRGDERSGREQSIIERQVNHLIHLVDDLLDISRITRGKVQLQKRPHKLASLVTRAVEIAGPACEERKHHVAVVLPREDIWLEADETRLCQVLTNLITNSAKYTPPGGQIELRAERIPTGVRIRVIDNGNGIAPDLLPRIFDLFVQGHRTSDRQQGGLGIGLALVRNLVQMHDGTVSARSEGHGRGAEFVVELPTIELASRALAPAEIVMRQRVQVTPRRILVVDDNEDAGELMAEVLRSVGHEVVCTIDGPRALEAIKRFTPEVAILDIGLPVMDGYELAQAMRAAIRDVRLMAVTGYGQEQDRARALAAGFEQHFVKPVSPQKVIAAIEIAPNKA